MSNRSAAETAGKLAKFIRSIIDIVKGFGQGGWVGAIIQAVKHYWPQILAIAIALILIPLVIYCCIPMIYFGYESSEDTEIAALTEQAGKLADCYDQYDVYIDDWVEQIQSSITATGAQNTETNETSGDTGTEQETEYEVTVNGGKIQKNWFIALHVVSVKNDPTAVTEEDIRDFAGKCVAYTVKPAEETAAAMATESTSEVELVKMLLEINYLTPKEIMASCGYTQADENWARLIHKTLEKERNSVVGVLGPIFEDPDWRNHIASDFGYRTNPYVGFHYGVDIGMAMGTPICAVKDGTVTTSIHGSGGYGYYIIIDHADGVQTLYAHCSELLVSVGDEVKKGDVIAKVGSTGRSTGPHVHFEVRINGECVDPLPYIL